MTNTAQTKDADAQSGSKPTSLWRSIFSADLRSIGLFRILLGCSLLIDLLIRLRDFESMYLDSGMFPAKLIRRLYPTDLNWSFHFLADSPWFLGLMFGLQVLAALALTIGFFPRLAALLSWLLALSLHNRVPPILNASDALVKLLLLWSLFLPLGSVWAMGGSGAKRKPPAAPRGPIHAAGVTAVMCQMAMMYFFSAIYKTNADWFRGDVISVTLSHDFYAKPLAEGFLRFPWALKVLTWGIFLLEWVGPLFLLSPFLQPRLRTIAVLSLMGMHLGIEALVHVGMFSWVSIAGLSIFLPAGLWDRVNRRGTIPTEAAGSDTGTAPLRWDSGGSWGNGLGYLLLVYVVGMNVSGVLNLLTVNPIRFGHRFLNLSCGLGQKWSMFGDAPSMDGWYVARASLADGSKRDLMRGGEAMDWSRPSHPGGLYRNHRWRKLFREMGYTDSMGFQNYREPVARFMIRSWNATNPPSLQIREFEFIFCTDENSRPTPGVSSREVLLKVAP